MQVETYLCLLCSVRKICFGSPPPTTTTYMFLRPHTSLTRGQKSNTFWGPFLPPLMHLVIVSGVGMARNQYLGTDSSWINVEIEQFLLMQFKRWILNWTNGSPSPAPPIIACPLPSCTMACLKSPIGNFGPENKGNTISCLVRNHVKLLHVYKLRRGFSKGTVLCGGY